MPDEQRRSERAARIAGGRLNPDVSRTALRGGCGRWPRSSAPRRRPGTDSSRPSRAWTCRAIRSMISSVTTWIDAARSISRWVSGDSGLRGGPPNSAVELRRGHRQPLAVVEVRHVHPERAVGLQVDQLARGSGRAYFGSPYGARPISLYSPEFTLNPQKYVNAEYSSPSECGKRSSCVSVELVALRRRRSWRSPIRRRRRRSGSPPRSNGDGKNALAACDS